MRVKRDYSDRLLAILWPDWDPRTQQPCDNEIVVFFWRAFGISMRPELRVVLLVIFAAALGSYIHAVTSFATFVGNRQIVASWCWWYVLRIPIGVSVGLVCFFLIRGGLVAPGAGSSAVNPYGITAVAALAGMFSKQATDKLEELFKHLFKVADDKGDARRLDPLEHK